MSDYDSSDEEITVETVFNATVKRPPYTPYVGLTYNEVVKSFREINKDRYIASRNNEIIKFKLREEFNKLMRYISEK